jgi:hypothetical protein
MRRWPLALAVLLVLATSGCVPILSVFPYFAQEDVVFDDGLLGDWIPCEAIAKTTQAGATSAFPRQLLARKGDAHAYKLMSSCWPAEHEDCVDYERSGIRSALTATLFAVGGRRYLDVVGGLGGDDENVFLGGAWTMSPAHSLFRVALGNGRMAISYLDDEKVKAAILGGDVVLPHRAEPDGDLLLTATTKVLRKTVLKRADELGLFVDYDEYCHVPQESAPGRSSAPS